MDVSLTEIQEEIAKLSDEDREILAAWLALQRETKTPQFRQELGEAMRRMDAGRKVTEEQVEAAHERLVAGEG